MAQLELIAATAFGLEAVTTRELKALGYEGKGIQPGRVLFRGDSKAICRTNLWLRSADRILIRMGEFEATDFGQLFDATNALPWEQWLPADAEFPVSGRTIKSQLSSIPACQKIVKKAIVERLRSAHGTADLPETGSQFRIDLSLRHDVVTLSIDTTGHSLHKRGYRTLVGEAPLKETLAAAMILLSYWKPGRRLLDPFCGSGTIPIEAAMIGRNLAPGLNREFTSERWPQLGKKLWAAAREEARDLIQPDFEPCLVGTDIDPEALGLARYHASQAGVESLVHFQRRDFADLASRDEYGVLITNPPYGERLGDAAEIERLYESMPDILGRLETWSIYILTAQNDLERKIDRRADRRRKLYNGRIQCTYFQFYGPRPPQAESAEDLPES